MDKNQGLASPDRECRPIKLRRTAPNVVGDVLSADENSASAHMTAGKDNPILIEGIDFS
jgi:hypothetical protein